MKESKYFCVLPWVHAQFNFDNKVYACCQMTTRYCYGDQKTDEISHIWNGQEIEALRNRFLENEPRSECVKCWNLEKAGVISKRQASNLAFLTTNSPDRTGSENQPIVPPYPVFLDLRLSNVCNFRCRTCGPESSTSWHREIEETKRSGLLTVHSTQLSPRGLESIQSLEPLLPSVKKIYFAGGEPLLQREHYMVLERLRELGRSDIVLEYSTNLSALSLGKWHALQLWQYFKNVSLGISLDGVFEQAELLRSGTIWKDIENNFKKIRAFAPHVKWFISPTVSAMNAFHLPHAVNHWIRNGMVSVEGHLRLNILYEPHFLSLNVLETTERASLKKIYSRFLEQLHSRVGAQLWNSIKKEFDLVFQAFSKNPLPEERVQFKRYMDTIDQVRGEAFSSVFPEFKASIRDLPLQNS